LDNELWLVVGLGNPGTGYRDNRHNIGFMVLEKLASEAGVALGREKFKAIYGTGEIGGHKVVMLMPQTYMNRSGESVGRTTAFFKVPLERVLVLHDEIDLPLGVVRVKPGGGHGGHNGLRDLHRVLGSGDYLRVRLGVGRPPRGRVESWVLSDFGADEQMDLDDALERAADAVVRILRDGVKKAANKINGVRPLRERQQAEADASEDDN